MVNIPTYPLNVTIPSSLRKKFDPIQLRYFANNIENHINEAMRNTSSRIFSYREIADAAGIFSGAKTVRRFLAPIGGGNTGITVHNPKAMKK